MEVIQIFDTTLRDGEQSPGFSMDSEEKLRLARQLERLGVDVIEAGFPIASRTDAEAVSRIAKEIHGCRIAALARAKQEDIDAALGALESARRPRLHVFLATSDLHLHYKLRATRAEVLDTVARMVRYGRERCEEVEFSAEDASRSDVDFLCQVFAAAAEAGATILNIPDTVGYALPEEYANIFRRVREHLAAVPGVILSAHCHNDLGLAVANSLAAVGAGARQIECTLKGIGERAGNASLEEVGVALAVRQPTLGARTNLRLGELYPASQLLSSITGVLVPPNKAVVGANAFAHEAGIHQDGIIKNPLTYEIIRPETVGAPSRQLVLGRHSGRNALRHRLKELGYEIGEEQLGKCYQAVMSLAARSKQVTDADLRELIRNSDPPSANGKANSPSKLAAASGAP
jgi:2-isopropylmalate synthase